MSVNSKMTALADEIRTLGGTTAKMGIDAMTTEVTAANTEIAEQADLIAQIQTALESKAAGGDAEPVLQDKTVSPTTSSQTIEPDSGYDGLSSVTVNAMPTATQATPSITVSSSGLITASATQTAGYVSAGTKSGTKQLTTQAAKTITPSTSSQTAVAKDVYTTGAVTVAAIPSTYVKPSATKAATTYTPSTSNQTIAAGTYCSGVQTIKGDSNLKAENIVAGISIFGVTGTHSGGGSGSSNAGEWIAVNSLPTTYLDPPGAASVTVYYEIPENCKSVVFREPDSNITAVSYLSNTGEFTSTHISTDGFNVSDADGTGTVLKIIYTQAFNDVLLLPIFATT